MLVASEKLSVGESYIVTIGDEKHEITNSEKSTIVGTQASANPGFGKGFGR